MAETKDIQRDFNEAFAGAHANLRKMEAAKVDLLNAIHLNELKRKLAEANAPQT